MLRITAAIIVLVSLLSTSAEARRYRHYRAHPEAYQSFGTFLSHPAGCPSRAFCGCGAAVEVFGSPRRDLWLAANWLRFPRTAPAPGMVAARRGHVFVLRNEVSPGVWMVADHNSGGHRSRLHVRSLAGYAVVNPHS